MSSRRGWARAIEVVRAGPLTTVQDEGRPGHAHLGVPRSGALDGPAMTAANRLIGNAEAAAVLETTFGGVAIRALVPCTVGVAGASAAVTVDGRAFAGAPVGLRAGQVLDVGRARRGLRSYVAVDGGIAVEPVLGSRSTDVLSGLGPPPLRDGARLPLGPAGAEPGSDVDPAAGADELDRPPVLTVRLGPRDDWFTATAIDTFAGAVYTASPVSNRVALRLDGPPLQRARPGELPSEGVVLGAVQVTSDGRPLVFLNDHPTIGGYPVIGVVDPADLPRCAQARPGTAVRFEVRSSGYGAAS